MVLAASALAHRVCLPGTLLPPCLLHPGLLLDFSQAWQDRAAGRYMAALASGYGCPGNGPGAGWGWKALGILS